MRTLPIAVPFLLALSPLPAQFLLRSHSLPVGSSCVGLWPAGDMNGDGTQDFVVIARDPLMLVSVVLVSGATGTPMHTLPDPDPMLPVREAVGVGDVDGDNRSDVLLVTSSLLRVYSGASGSVLAALPLAANLRADCGCGVGDFDGDGRADVAVGLFDSTSSAITLQVLRGHDLSTITAFTASVIFNSLTLRAVGDITGDGKSELAICGDYDSPQVFNAVNGGLVWEVLPPSGFDPGRGIDTLDLDGDGKREVFFFRPGPYGPDYDGTLSVHDAVTGTKRFERHTSAGSYSRLIAGVGDLDHDGRQDFAQNVRDVYSSTSRLLVSSGADGRRLWLLPNWLPGVPTGEGVAPLGDVDGDTYGDFAAQWAGQFTHGWHTISGKILAESQPQTGACGAGPFFPRLGATRPILGQTLTIAGQDAPNGVGGVLVLSLQPTAPTWLGASSCTAYFDLGAGFALAPVTGTPWTVALPLPLVPQLAGLEVALQAFWSPTAGPLGYDLSNGVWARLGWQ